MVFIRYLNGQFFVYLVDMSVFWILVKLMTIKPLLSNVIGKIVALLFAFTIHKNLTFGISGNKELQKQILRFLFVFWINTILSSFLLTFVLHFLKQSVLAKLFLDICFFIPNYWLCKRYIFFQPFKEGGEPT